MLAGVLLHMVAAAANIDQATDPASLLRQWRGFHEMKDRAVFPFRNFAYAQGWSASLRRDDRASVESLATTGGVKSRAVKNDCCSRIRGRNYFQNFGFEFMEKRIVIVETFGHVFRTTPASCELPAASRARHPRDAGATLVRPDNAADLARCWQLPVPLTLDYIQILQA